MLRPIPKSKLPHNATYNPYLTNTGEVDTYSTSISLKNVKIEERKQLKVINNGREIVGNAIMFYDYINSTGLTSRPINNSQIVFNGYTYHVVDTDILYADSCTPHHYEVLLR